MSSDKIRIGFIGAGANTTLRHLPGFKEMDNVELTSVANRSLKSSQGVASDWDIPNVYDNWVDLIEAPDTNAICIGTWPYMHCAMVLKALENNKHVLTEARMAMDADEAHIMLDASREKPELISQIVPAPHTLKVDRTIKELIETGYLGEILSVDLTVHQGNFVDFNGPFHWRHNRDLSGYNIMQMGIWYEAMMRWLGPAESVLSLSRVHVKSRKDTTGVHQFITIPDHVEILSEMTSGPVVRMRFSTVTGLAPGDTVWFFGTKGTLKLDSTTMTLSGGQNDATCLTEIEIAPDKKGQWRVEEEFINAIRGIEPVTHTNFQDGVKYMEFTEAVTRSSQSGQKVNLPL